jgi:ATP-binding cassette subfamily F protein uup
MEETEAKIKKLTEMLTSIDASDYVKIQEVSKEIEELKSKLDEHTMLWLELSE